jgi:hypothetical protein
LTRRVWNCFPSPQNAERRSNSRETESIDVTNPHPNANGAAVKRVELADSARSRFRKLGIRLRSVPTFRNRVRITPCVQARGGRTHRRRFVLRREAWRTASPSRYRCPLSRQLPARRIALLARPLAPLASRSVTPPGGRRSPTTTCSRFLEQSLPRGREGIAAVFNSLQNGDGLQSPPLRLGNENAPCNELQGAAMPL